MGQAVGSPPRLKEGVVTGEIECVSGGELALIAAITDERMAGTIGDRTFEAVRTAEPPPPGSSSPRPAGLRRGPLRDRAAVGLPRRSGRDRGRRRPGRAERRGGAHGELAYGDGVLSGEVTCADGCECRTRGRGRRAQARADRRHGPAAQERLTATEEREFGEMLAVFFLIVALVMLAARLFGAGCRPARPAAGDGRGGGRHRAWPDAARSDRCPTCRRRLPAGRPALHRGRGQPRPDLLHVPRRARARPRAAARAGRAGGGDLQRERRCCRWRSASSWRSRSTSWSGRTRSSWPSRCSSASSMSVTAFPVLARILVERRMLKQPRRCARRSPARPSTTSRPGCWSHWRPRSRWPGSAGEVIATLGLAVAFCLVMGFAVRPLLARVSEAYDEAGRVPSGWIAAIFAGILLSAYTTETIGIALIFGAFVMGLIMPRQRRADRGRHRPHRGLRGHAAAAAVLRLHRAAHRHRPARPARRCGC